MGAGSSRAVGLLSTVANALDAVTVTGRSLKGFPIEYYKLLSESDHPKSDAAKEQPKDKAD